MIPEPVALELLNLLETKQQDLDILIYEKETAMMLVVPVEVLEKQKAIAEEYAISICRTQNLVAELRASVETAVIREGHTVKGDMLMAVYNRGRETWDGKLLAGFALAHPEIEAARKVGNPTISIRKI